MTVFKSKSQLISKITYGIGAGLNVMALATIALGFWPSQAVFANSGSSQNSILVPDIGTAGVLGISLQKEIALGDFFIRTARAHMPVVDDPVLNEYVNTLGNRLVQQASNVHFPFTFFLVGNEDLNASAFLGGKIAINTGLFNYAETEDEFASVIAHEITHITQRHIARFVESTMKATQLSTAGFIGALALSLLNPAFGAAAISTTLGASMQARINFTRDNEYEADRLGMKLLYDAGLNPMGMVDMFKRLYSMQGNINPAFALLIDHPLSDARVAEAQNRALQLEQRADSKNPNYEFAKARVAVRYTKNDYKILKRRLASGVDNFSKEYRLYALALTCFELKEYQEAYKYLQQIGPQYQKNLFVIDLLTDLDIQTKRTNQAITRLVQEYKKTPLNQVIVVNLANAYNENMQYSRAKEVLNRYLTHRETDVLALSLLETTHNKLRDRCSALQTRGEILALGAAYPQAIGSYNEALKVCSNHLTRERIKARVAQIVTQRSFDEELLQR